MGKRISYYVEIGEGTSVYQNVIITDAKWSLHMHAVVHELVIAQFMVVQRTNIVLYRDVTLST